MEEELQKRNTDCVYFLASPLTCKKGAECEYRHSEMARLNPRDCWFWLSGTCLNPTCAFRHPPLEKPAETASESRSVTSQAPQPTNKPIVPCFFYFQGFCGKGDKCAFSHSPDGSTPAAKSFKAPSVTNSDVHPVDNNKTSTGNKIAAAPTEAWNNLSVTAKKPSDNVKLPSRGEVQQLVPKNAVQKGSSLQIAASNGKGADIIDSDSVLPSENYNEDRSYMGADQNSEDHVDDRVEPEERWESSPGFDVLVDNEENQLHYEDEQEYMAALDRDPREVDDHYIEYGFENPIQHEEPLGSSQFREMDLRDHLRKRRAVDCEPFSRSSRRRDDSSHPPRWSHDRPYEHGLSERLRGRLASEVGRTGVNPINDYGIHMNGGSHHGRLRHSQFDRPREYRERRGVARRPFIPSDVRRKPFPRERRSSEVCGEFSAPKSLAEIREEKRKAELNGYHNEREEEMGGMESANFDGPKPLNEILKEKNKLGSSVECDNGSCSN
ncbi:Zinc finger CCCH domain-containing protein 19 [Linum perenne]